MATKTKDAAPPTEPRGKALQVTLKATTMEVKLTNEKLSVGATLRLASLLQEVDDDDLKTIERIMNTRKKQRLRLDPLVGWIVQLSSHREVVTSILSRLAAGQQRLVNELLPSEQSETAASIVENSTPQGDASHDKDADNEVRSILHNASQGTDFQDDDDVEVTVVLEGSATKRAHPSQSGGDFKRKKHEVREYSPRTYLPI